MTKIARLLSIILCIVFVLDLVQAANGAPKGPKEQYLSAYRAYNKLAKSSRLRRDRKAWIRVINAFRKVYLSWPDNEKYAPKSLYMMARVYRELYGYSGNKKDLKKAIERYEVLFERFPSSAYADDALYYAGLLYWRMGQKAKAREYWGRIVQDYSGSDFYRLARKRLGKKAVERLLAAKKNKAKGASSKQSTRTAGKRPTVTAIRHWSEKDYTRVVIDVSRSVHYNEGYLSADPRRGLPRRLYLDLVPARVSKALDRKIVIGDGLLKAVRVAQFDQDTARVVFDLGKTSNTRIFNLEEPFRIVVDAFGEKYPQKKPRPIPKGKLTLAQQLGLCVRTIVVDPGHGGKDPGAIGPTGLREKDVVLKVAKLIKKELERRLDAKVILTRSKDRFLPLEERTAIANAKKADLFVSIHCNAAPSRRLKGVETYFLNFALDEEAMRVAAMENAIGNKRIGDIRSILTRIMKNTKVEESRRLATFVQKGLVTSLKKRYSGVKDLGVKQAPFFVLIGARMPSILAEISFISNKREERRLRSPKYLEAIAKGIADGIEEYIKETELVAQRAF